MLKFVFAILSTNLAEFGRKSLTIVKITINQKFMCWTLSSKPTEIVVVKQ